MLTGTCAACLPPPCPGLQRLQELSLRGCEHLTEAGLQHISGLTTLTFLSLEQCPRVSGLHCLAAMQQLRVLELGWCDHVVDEDMIAVACLQRLTRLQLSMSGVCVYYEATVKY